MLFGINITKYDLVIGNFEKSIFLDQAEWPIGKETMTVKGLSREEYT